MGKLMGWQKKGEVRGKVESELRQEGGKPGLSLYIYVYMRLCMRENDLQS